MAIVVHPAGTFDASPRKVGKAESRGYAWVKSQATHDFTEDDEGGWTRMFAVGKKPSAHLINARREFVWKHEREPNPAEWARRLAAGCMARGGRPGAVFASAPAPTLRAC